MAKQAPLMEVINEMMEHAAKEIGCEHSEENVDQIIFDLEHDYSIQLNPLGPVHAEFMMCVCQAIIEWKHNTKENCPEMCGGA